MFVGSPQQNYGFPCSQNEMFGGEKSPVKTCPGKRSAVTYALSTWGSASPILPEPELLGRPAFMDGEVSPAALQHLLYDILCCCSSLLSPCDHPEASRYCSLPQCCSPRMSEYVLYSNYYFVLQLTFMYLLNSCAMIGY